MTSAIMLVWNPRLELGVRVLDTHHRRLVDMANEVFAIVKAGAPLADVLKKLRELADFAAWHFGFEEDLMAETTYQDGTFHGEQHGELLGQLERFVERVKAGSAGPLHSAKTFAFLGAWVTRHIQLTDRPLAAHLLNRGWDPLRDNQI